MHADPDLADRLRDLIAHEVGLSPGEVELSGLQRSGTGTSRENFEFDATWPGPNGLQTHALLLRRDPPHGVVDTDRSTEFELLRWLSGAGLPIPGVRWIDDGERLGRPAMVVDRLRGRAHRGVLRDVDPLRIGQDAQLGLAQDMCDVLAELHALDADAGPLAASTAASPAEEVLDHWVGVLDAEELEPQPELRITARWLAAHMPPPPSRRVIVHGDFRPANVLVHDRRLAAVLDWELAHGGDPVDDLGWYCTAVYRAEHFMPGRWEQADFLARYEARSGIHVDEGALRFWRVMSSFRLAVIALTGVRAFCALGAERPAGPIRSIAVAALREALTEED